MEIDTCRLATHKFFLSTHVHELSTQTVFSFSFSFANHITYSTTFFDYRISLGVFGIILRIVHIEKRAKGK